MPNCLVCMCVRPSWNKISGPGGTAGKEANKNVYIVWRINHWDMYILERISHSEWHHPGDPWIPWSARMTSPSHFSSHTRPFPPLHGWITAKHFQAFSLQSRHPICHNRKNLPWTPFSSVPSVVKNVPWICWLKNTFSMKHFLKTIVGLSLTYLIFDKY